MKSRFYGTLVACLLIWHSGIGHTGIIDTRPANISATFSSAFGPDAAGGTFIADGTLLVSFTLIASGDSTGYFSAVVAEADANGPGNLLWSSAPLTPTSISTPNEMLFVPNLPIIPGKMYFIGFDVGIYTSTFSAGGFRAYGVADTIPGEVWLNTNGQGWGNVSFVDVATRIEMSSSETVVEKAVDLANSLVDYAAPYFRGGIGWDSDSRLWADSDVVASGYTQWERGTISGVDCSGLVKWAYNKAYNEQVWASSNIVADLSADGIFDSNSDPIGESDLQAGDLIFIDDDLDPQMDHVIIYTGQGNTAEAASEEYGIINSTLSEVKNRSGDKFYGRISDSRIAMSINAHSPIELDVTDPEGYRITPDTVEVTSREILREIPRQLYYSISGIGPDGHPETTVFSPLHKEGAYLIRVILREGAKTGDTYSIDMIANGQKIFIATDVPVEDAPEEGYGVYVDDDGLSDYMPINIDLRPNSNDDTLNTKSRSQKIPVAIYSSENFDATKIDLNTLTLAGTATPTSNKKGIYAISEQDLDGDSLVDIILHFKVSEIGLSGSESELTLEGQTFDGELIRGVFNISIK